jgi:hypothetical protein
MLFMWRKAITSAYGPSSAVTRHVLLTLSMHMNGNGGSCFPSTKTLAAECAMSERSICTHLEKAVKQGWLQKRILGIAGQGWRRHSYEAAIPDNVLKQVQHLTPEAAEKGSAPIEQGTERHDRKALKPVQSSASINSLKNYMVNTLKNIQHVEVKQKQTPKVSRKTNPPQFFPVTPEMQTWALSKGFHGDLHRETEKFLDHHRAKGSLFASWPAAWRTWINRAVEYAGPGKKILSPKEYNHDEIYS